MRTWRAAMLVTTVLVAGAGPSACRKATPSVVEQRPDVPEVHSAPAPSPQTKLVIRVGERRLYMVDDAPETPDESFPIAVGREGLETPVGRFQVEEMVEHPDYEKVTSGVVIERIPPGPKNPLGERWIGFAHGPGWTIGIHGTPQPDLLGHAVSHGCVRMRNADVVRIYERVRIGTPVVVEP